MRVKIFDLSWNVDLNRLENEINAFLATVPTENPKRLTAIANRRGVRGEIDAKLV
jgi:hypothetical protein